MTTLLETSGLQNSFGAIVAAKDISVVARRGQRLGLIANNGASKTTFVNLVTGYLRSDARRVVLDGEDITGLESRRVRRARGQPILPDPAALCQPYARGESADRARDREQKGIIILAARAFDHDDGRR
jgi:ABC-type lipopolysaccharide export system ATPase subunit